MTFPQHHDLQMVMKKEQHISHEQVDISCGVDSWTMGTRQEWKHREVNDERLFEWKMTQNQTIPLPRWFVCVCLFL
jgi:hypothetical protein